MGIGSWDREGEENLRFCTCKCKILTFVKDRVDVRNRPCRRTPLFLAGNRPNGSRLPRSLWLKNQGVRIQADSGALENYASPKKESPFWNLYLSPTGSLYLFWGRNVLYLYKTASVQSWQLFLRRWYLSNGALVPT